MSDNPFRELPSIDELRRDLRPDHVGGDALTAFLSDQLSAWRDRIASGERIPRSAIVAAIRQEMVRRHRRRLEPVLNATGVVLHTNLGRAPVSPATAAAMAAAAGGYASVELEPETGRRGGRMREISDLMRVLTGAEATLVVNNNAAAVLLTLAALAAGREVIVSRGEAVEIGGGFRIPDVLAQSGARLVDVGTTNRTYPADFERAFTGETAVFLKVHASNFQIDGFTRGTTVAELREASERLGVPIVEDLGSGALMDVEAFGLAHEPTIGESIAAGAALVTASGDKLLGGPQAGLIVGKTALIERIERHPLARALRADKTVLAGIGETLRHYARGDATREIPIWRMLAAPVAELISRAAAIAADISSGGGTISVVETRSTIGGGSLPGQTQPSAAVRIADVDAEGLAKLLRTGTPRVFGRIEHDALLLDLRAVLPEQDERLFGALQDALNRVESRPA